MKMLPNDGTKLQISLHAKVKRISLRLKETLMIIFVPKLSNGHYQS